MRCDTVEETSDLGLDCVAIDIGEVEGIITSVYEDYVIEAIDLDYIDDALVRLDRVPF